MYCVERLEHENAHAITRKDRRFQVVRRLEMLHPIHHLPLQTIARPHGQPAVVGFAGVCELGEEGCRVERGGDEASGSADGRSDAHLEVRVRTVRVRV